MDRLNLGQQSLEAEYAGPRAGMRRSLSMNDIPALEEDLMTHNDEEEVYQRYSKANDGPQELSRTKFVSMAEANYHFQSDTPGRFRTTRQRNYRPQYNGPTGLTRLQSPNLRFKARARFHQHIMTQKEKEEMELEEIRKFKIKANPVPKWVLEGSKNVPEVSKRPPTVPKPFKLTEIHKKSVQSPEHYHFKARPAPKHILEKPQVPNKKVQAFEKHGPLPCVPFSFQKRDEELKIQRELRIKQQIEEERKLASQFKARVYRPLHPVPFSFQKRDDELKIQRELRIKQEIEEERKLASQFKAQPLPGAVRKRMASITAKAGSSTTSSENKENHVRFEKNNKLLKEKEEKKRIKAEPRAKP